MNDGDMLGTLKTCLCHRSSQKPEGCFCFLLEIKKQKWLEVTKLQQSRGSEFSRLLFNAVGHKFITCDVSFSYCHLPKKWLK